MTVSLQCNVTFRTKEYKPGIVSAVSGISVVVIVSADTSVDVAGPEKCVMVIRHGFNDSALIEAITLAVVGFAGGGLS